MNPIKLFGFPLAGAVIASAFVAHAEAAWPTVNYGETLTLTSEKEDVAESPVTIAGKLIVKGGTQGVGTADYSPVPLTFGSPTGSENPAEIVVEGGQFGEANGNLVGRTEVTMVGAGGKVTVKGGEYHANKFTIAAGTEADEDGYIDFLRIEGGVARIREAWNNTSATGRITVAGGSYQTQHGWYGTMFNTGCFLFRSEIGAPIVVDMGNTHKEFVSGSARVAFAGDADVEFRYAAQENWAKILHDNVTFDNNGKVIVGGSAGGVISIFGGQFGPGVTDLVFKDGVCPILTKNITLTCNLLAQNPASLITGSARITFDASVRDLTLDAQFGDGEVSLTKLGANTLTIATVTNIHSLAVSEGTVKVTSDCRIDGLRGGIGACLVADGAKVTLCQAVDRLKLMAINGGEFVYEIEGSDAFIGPSELSGRLHLASGKLNFSKGIEKSFWRWTFTEINNGPAPLIVRSLWTFGTDGTWLNNGCWQTSDGTPYATFQEAQTSILPVGRSRYLYDETKEIAEGKTGYCFFWLYHVMFDNTNNQNNNGCLSLPLIDPSDAKSAVAIEFRTADEKAPASCYAISTLVSGSSTYPKSWIVEASDDGLTWTKVDERTVTLPDDFQGYRFYGSDVLYNNGMTVRPEEVATFRFSNHIVKGLDPMAEALDVQLDDGTELDLTSFTDGQAVGAIKVDLAETTGGTLKGAKIAATGRLDIATEGAKPGAGVLPLKLEEPIDAGNLKGWDVYLNGAKTHWKVGYDSESGKVSLEKNGLVLILQ